MPQRQKANPPEVVLITGCSSGFGLELARLFAAGNYQVIATLRGPAPPGPPVFPANVRVVHLNVNDVSSIEAARTIVLDKYGRLDILVNNAGIDTLGAFEDMHEQNLREVMETNFFGALRVTRAFLPIMREQGHGTIAMVSSLIGVVTMPGTTAYAASKWALEAASEILQHEVLRWGIRVCVLQPGYSATQILREDYVRESSPTDSPYRSLIEYLYAAELAQQQMADSPGKMAAEMYDGIVHSSKFRIPIGRGARSVTLLKRLLGDEQGFALLRARTKLEWWITGAVNSPEPSARAYTNVLGTPPSFWGNIKRRLIEGLGRLRKLLR